MSRPLYPNAELEPIVEDLHGHRITDPYRWLEDASDERTIVWSTAQDQLYEAHQRQWRAVEPLRSRLATLVACGSVSSPVWRGQRRFLSRRTPSEEHSRLLTVDPDGTERVLVDPMAIDPSGTTTLDAWQPSKEGHLLAYQLSEGGTEESVLRVIDVVSGELVDGPIDRTRFSPVAWLPGGKAFYYVRRLPPSDVPAGEEQYHRRLYLHQVGTPASEDVVVFGEGQDMTAYYDVSVSMDGRWLTLGMSEGTAPRNDLWMADLAQSTPETPRWQVVQQGIDASTSAHVGRADTRFADRIYLATDREAPRGRLCVASIGDFEDGALPYERWRDLVPEAEDAVMEGYTVLDHESLPRPLLLVSWTRHAVSEISVHDAESGERIGEVPLPGLGTTGALRYRPEGGSEVWFAYNDHTTPPTIYRYDGVTQALEVWDRCPGQVEVPDVVTRQVVYPSKDGTPVRMFLISRADLTPAPDADPDQPRPTILSGYGGFGISQVPGYSAGILSWVEAGGVYAVANLRGGCEEGEQWHRAGMRGAKQNVFDDFDAATDWLVEHGWTTREQLGISGGSNGGLLVGAELTQHPGSVAAVVCSAPLLDMVRYERFGLGELWSDEYGTASDPEELGWLLSYSPYHHVREGVAYPAVLFTVFDGDTRVDPLHARKLAASLQQATVGDRPVLLRRERDVGHGARAVSRGVSLTADTLGFLADQLGLRVETAATRQPHV